MPSRKPQVMYAGYKGDKMYVESLKMNEAGCLARLLQDSSKSWPELQQLGWAIIQVEVRETKKGK